MYKRQEYAQLAADDMKKAVKKAGTQARKDIQENAPVKTGAYACLLYTSTPSSRSRIVAGSAKGKELEDEMEALLGGDS